MKDSSQKKIIMLSGGGTGGSVTPLLALADYLKQKDPGAYDFVFVGTKRGPERYLVEEAGLPLLTITAGKWRRYFSLLNFFDLGKIFLAFFQSLFLLLRQRPQILLSAGGFVSVPLAYAAWFLRIPVLIHQQDVRAGLANKLMAKVARQVTVTFEKSLADYGAKAVWVGNPMVEIKLIAENLWPKYNLDEERPLLLVLGGGTGSAFINWLVKDSLSELLGFTQVLHITGPGKGAGVLPQSGYCPLEFMDHAELLWFMDKARVVVSRCGLGVLTEIAALGKAAILIPMPKSHQEDNAQLFGAKHAAIVLAEENISSDIFIAQARKLVDRKKPHMEMSGLVKQVIKSANEPMRQIIARILS